MVSDPYKVLGVSPNAGPDEIKKAYRQKAKENHPDLHPDDPKANEKMNEINEAYDMLTHPEKYRARQQQEQQRREWQQAHSQGYGQQDDPFRRQSGSYGPFGSQNRGAWQSYDGWFDFDQFFGSGFSGQTPPPREEPGDRPEVRRAVEQLNSRGFKEAADILMGVPSAYRDARWHYLFSLSMEGTGNTMTAQEEMQRAVQMDPNNTDYHRHLQRYRQANEAYEQRGRGFNMGAMDPSRICMAFCLANMMCRCCCR